LCLKKRKPQTSRFKPTHLAPVSKTTQEIKHCVESIALEKKSFWNEFIKTPQFETTLILTFGFIMEHLL